MKLTVVGFWGGFPGREEATSGYLLEDQGFRLLIDCGSGVLSQLQRYTTIESLDAVILSHYHHDHVADIGSLQFARLVKKQLTGQLPTLPIYGHQLNPDGFSRLSFEAFTEGVAYNIDQQLDIGPFNISFIETKHSERCAAMRFSNGETTIVYTGDTSYFPELADFASGADLLVAECSLYKDQDGETFGHLNSLDVGRLAAAAEVKSLVLTHLPHYGDHEDLVNQARSRFDGYIFLAKSGLVFNI